MVADTATNAENGLDVREGKRTMSLVELIPSLEPRLEQLLVRHREASAAIDWSYHDYLPLEAYHADPHSHGPLSPVAYTAVETALLTEANLPWYTAVLYRRLSKLPLADAGVRAGVDCRGGPARDVVRDVPAPHGQR